MNEETPTDSTSRSSQNLKLFGAALLALAVTGGAASLAGAQDAPTDTRPPVSEQAPSTRESVPADGELGDHEGFKLEGCDFDIKDLSEEELAEIKSQITTDMDALREAFDAAGIAYAEVPDEELGINIVEWDFEDEAANTVADEVFDKAWAVKFGSMGQNEKAMIIGEVTAENEALRKAFDEAGIAYTEVTDNVLGVPIIEWDFEDEAAWAVADQVFEQMFDDMFEELEGLGDGFGVITKLDRVGPIDG